MTKIGKNLESEFHEKNQLLISVKKNVNWQIVNFMTINIKKTETY